MNPFKEDKVKANCFKNASIIFAATIEPGEGISFTEQNASTIYSIAISLFNNGKDRYWKSMKTPYSYQPRILKRIYLWLRDTFWENRVPK